jgi:mRNA-degrading endonuclease RelE of RelBE toxin-antitoxin system
MRRSRDLQPGTAYTVDISPSAWSQLAMLTTEDYSAIRERLDVIAVELTASQPPQPSAAPPRQAHGTDTRAFVVEGYAVLYLVDPERGQVTLLEVTRRIPEEE